MLITAFDLSLTCTGCAGDQGVGTIVPPKTAASGIARLRFIRDAVLDRAVGLVVLEGYSFGSKGRAVYGIAELGGVVRVALFEAGLTVVEVAPATLKKYAFGKGNCGKLEVLSSAIRRLEYAGSSADESDALWLRTAALDHYGLIASPVPAAHRAALTAVKWPALEGAGVSQSLGPKGQDRPGSDFFTPSELRKNAEVHR